MPDGRRRAPFSQMSATITGERDRFRPLASPVAVWAAFFGGVAGVAEAAGSRAVCRLWAWRWAGERFLGGQFDIASLLRHKDRHDEP